MGENLLIGSAVITLTVVIQTFGLILLAGLMPLLIRWLRLHRHYVGKSFAMVATVLGLFLLHTVEGSGLGDRLPQRECRRRFRGRALFLDWGILDRRTGRAASQPFMADFRVVREHRWFLLIGWSIAFLVAASTRYGPFRSGEHF